MSVTVDAVGPSSAGGGTDTSNDSTTASWVHTCSGTGRVVVVGVAIGNAASGTVTETVAYGASTMASLGKVAANNSTAGYVELFYLINPPTGPQVVMATVSAVSTITAGSISFNGAGSVGTAVTAFGSSATAAAAVTSTVSGNMVVDAACSGTAMGTSTHTNQWLRNTNTNTAAGAGAGSTFASTGGTVTMQYAVTSDFWSIIAVEVKAISAAPAVINAITTVTTNTEALSTNNTAFSLTTTANGSCVVCVCDTRSATVSIAALSGGGVEEWEQVGVYSFAANGTIAAETFSVFIGRVTSFGSAQTVTATGSASLSSVSGSFAWQILTTTGMSLGTSWVVEASGSLRNTTSSTNVTMPTLVPGGASRAYIGYGDPVNTATNTGITSGYTGTIETTASSALNQWISNLSVSTSQSPIGKQGTTGVSNAIGLIIYATNADPSIATALNIGAAGGQNHFKLDTAFAGYTSAVDLIEADLVAGWNTAPQFTQTSDGLGVQMMVNVAAPTIGSSFPRTELRELSTDGVTLNAFDPTSGVHWLRGRTKLTNLTVVKPTLVVAQIHDGITNFGDYLAINTQLSSGKVQLQVRVNGSASNLPHPYLDIAVGDEFDWMIYIDTGNWAFYINDLGTPYYTKAQYDALVALGTRTDAFAWTGIAEYYFKSGCYSNTNTASEGDATQFMQCELRYLQHWHTGWTVPPTISLPKRAQFAPFFGGM